MCLSSDALLQHLPSYLGFSYLGHGVSLHGCSSKAQPLLLTLDEGNQGLKCLQASVLIDVKQRAPGGHHEPSAEPINETMFMKCGPPRGHYPR